MNILGGSGVDVIQMLNTRVDVDLDITTGGQNDNIVIEQSDVWDSFRIDSGIGNDKLTVRDVRVDEDYSVTAGAGDDLLALTNLRVGDTILINVDPGNDKVYTSNVFAWNGADVTGTNNGNSNFYIRVGSGGLIIVIT
jgi:hypothetical protein